LPPRPASNPIRNPRFHRGRDARQHTFQTPPKSPRGICEKKGKKKRVGKSYPRVHSRAWAASA
jgi:hypothetical protein